MEHVRSNNIQKKTFYLQNIYNTFLSVKINPNLLGLNKTFTFFDRFIKDFLFLFLSTILQYILFTKIFLEIPVRKDDYVCLFEITVTSYYHVHSKSHRHMKALKVFKNMYRNVLKDPTTRVVKINVLNFY